MATNELGRSFGWDCKDRGSVLQQVWHYKDPSPLKSRWWRAWTFIKHVAHRQWCSLSAHEQQRNLLEFCLFELGFSSHLRYFHSHGDVTITGEGLQILTYSLHWWQFSIEGSLLCHLLWHGTSILIYNGHFEGPVTLIPVAERLAVEMILPVLTT